MSRWRLAPHPCPEVCDSRHCCTKRPHTFEEQKGRKRGRVGRTRSAPPAPSTFQLRSLTYKLDLCPRGAATGRPHALPPAPSAAPQRSSLVLPTAASCFGRRGDFRSRDKQTNKKKDRASRALLRIFTLSVFVTWERGRRSHADSSADPKRVKECGPGRRPGSRLGAPRPSQMLFCVITKVPGLHCEMSPVASFFPREPANPKSPV